VWGLALSLPLLIAFQLVSLLHIKSLQSTQTARQNLYFSLVTTEEVSRALFHMEMANSGFLLTGEKSFREPFNQHRDIVSSRYNALLKLTADDPYQQERLKTFKVKLTRWFELYNPLIKERRKQDFDDLAMGMSHRQNKTNVLKCKMLLEEMQRLLDELRVAQEQKSWLH
jgi:CHASE3 domain sensor protein